MFVSDKPSKRRMREAQNARRNRLEIVRARSIGQITRRDLLKWGLFTGAGALAWKHGLNPFVRSAYAAGIPTGAPLSPLFGVQPFTQAMPRFDVLPRYADPDTYCVPAPTRACNVTMQELNTALPGVQPGDWGPVEGRPPGELWAHQSWGDLHPRVAIEVTTQGARTNTAYNPGVASQHNSGIDPATHIPLVFHPDWPIQEPNSVWTFNGTIPPKLVMARYGEPILFRHHNKLPWNIAHNNGFGRHTLSTHNHNGHHGAENDGFTGAFFFPGQFYDYHWPITLAGHYSYVQNSLKGAADNRDRSSTGLSKAGMPDDSGGIIPIPGDWRETMSTHWFHDHMFEHTAENVYKGNAGMMNLYSALDRGNEAINDGVNLRLPSGTANAWGNLEYDVNLMIADKAFDRDGQLIFDIFDDDGFLGDVMTVNLAYKPYMEVERRKYRFRILNGSVARFIKIALSDGKSFFQIANDGNLLPNRVSLTQLDEQATAERYDIVIDFTKWQIGQKVWMVNLASHVDAQGDANGRMPEQFLTIAQALSGTSLDPCVGKFLEFRIARNPAQPDLSQVPAKLIANPNLSTVPVVRERVFEFGRNAEQTIVGTGAASSGPWGISLGGTSATLASAYSRITARANAGTAGAPQREIWTLRNGGGGWDHPIHIHFEEGQILTRNGSIAAVPAWEKGRKDVYRLRPGGEVKITMQFRDFSGTFMQHCHNTSHEDHAMLMRWDINGGLTALPTPIPTPQGVTFRDPDENLDT